MNDSQIFQEYNEKGLLHLQGIIPNELCDEAAASLTKFTENLEPRNTNGLFSGRIVNFHMKDYAALTIATWPEVFRILNKLFSPYEMSAYTSLSFMVGTEQRIHRDCPHFYTWPEPDLFCGVWFALEDIDEQNGALEYYEGGHRVYIPSGETLKSMMFPKRSEPLNQQEIDELLTWYENLCSVKPTESRCIKRQICVKKGDVVIWHPKLPHGGGEVLNRFQTRKSMVVHCIPKGARVFNAKYFFNEAEVPEFCDSYSFNHCNGVPYVAQPQPFVQRSYL